MYSASRSITLAAKTGEPLPQINALADMYQAGNQFYRGSVMMVAGMPAAFKSMFTLFLAHEMNVPTLYISADSDAATQISRLAALVTGEESRSIRRNLEVAPDYYAEQLAGSNIHFSFDSNPDYYDIEEEIDAWVEMFDTYPEIIVVDNLRNVFSGQESEHLGYKTIQQKLIDLARQSHACVITMHHMSEASGDSKTPSRRASVDGKVNQLPDMILSVARDEDQFYLAVVKDRNAKDYPEADRFHTLRIDASHATFAYQESLQVRAQALGQAVEDNSWYKDERFD